MANVAPSAVAFACPDFKIHVFADSDGIRRKWRSARARITDWASQSLIGRSVET